MNKPWLKSYDEQVPEHIEVPDLSLFQLFQFAVEENPQGTATIFMGKKVSYSDLFDQVTHFSDQLIRLGVKKGDRVALLLPNIPGYVIAHFAVARAGGILVPTNPLYVERELEHQLKDSGAETIITIEELFDKVRKVWDRVPLKRAVVMSIKDFLKFPYSFLYRFKQKEKVRADVDKGIYLYSDMMGETSPDHPGVFVSPGDTAMFLYTGGTTGLSKGAVLTHRNIVTNAYQTRRWLWSLQAREEVIFCVLPFFHSYGMTTGMHLAVMVRSAMLLLPRFELPDVAKAIKNHQPTVFCAVPAMYNAINRYSGLSSEDVRSIQICVSGGAALPAEVQKKFEERTGGKLVEGYGLTESSPVALVNPTHGKRKNGTIGIPVSDTEARVVDSETGEPLPVGEVGELVLRGPQVMKEYWNRPEESEGSLREGWLHTGDMAEQDEDGFFRIVDRKKDVIISAGMNVYPREVEEVLHQHPKVVEAAVVGVPSRVREEIVKAYVVLEKGEELGKAELIEFCRDKLSKYKVPRKVEVVDELPKSAMGKTLKRKLKERESKEKRRGD